MPKRQPNPKSGQGRSRTRETHTPAPNALILIEKLALLILLALIPLRAVISETHTFEVPRMFRHLDTPDGAQPATTLLITGLIAAVMMTVGCARRYYGRCYHWTGAELGAALLFAAGIISFTQAGQKHLAMIGVLDFLGMVIYMLALRQLLTRPWHTRLTLVVILATGVIMITKCGFQHWIEYPETIKLYEKDKAELIQTDDSVEPGTRRSGFQHDFEKRLFARTPTGYYAHPNLLGSHLILIIMTALAVVSARLGEHRTLWALLLPFTIIVTGAIAMYATQSKGAMAACVIAIILWLIGHFFGRTLSNRPGVVLTTFWIIAALATGGFVAVLKAKPDALGRSMLFRSMYWDGAWDMMMDRGSLGVGADNFGRHFTKYKAVECPEEVESPHSWPVRFAAEWGILGLLGMLVLLFGVSFRLANKKRIAPEFQAQSINCLPGSVILWVAAIGVVVFGWRVSMLAGSPPAYWAMVLLIGTIPWFLAFVALAAESKEFPLFADDSPGPLLPALAAGLIGFLLHTGIDLALFSGGPATTFFALIAVALTISQSKELWALPESALATTLPNGETNHSIRTTKRKSAAMLAVGGAVIFGLFVIKYIHPTANVANDLKMARLNGEPSSWNAYTTSTGHQTYRHAIDIYPHDGTALSEFIEQLIPRVRTLEHVDIALELTRHLQDRDPHNSIAYYHLATLYRQRYELGKDIADLHNALDAHRSIVDAYPTSPNRRVYFANQLEELVRLTGNAEARAEAIQQLRTALDLDAKRIYVSKPNRFTEKQKTQIHERIERLANGT